MPMIISFIGILILILGLAVFNASLASLLVGEHPKEYKKEMIKKEIFLLVLGGIVSAIGAYLIFFYK